MSDEGFVFRRGVHMCSPDCLVSAARDRMICKMLAARYAEKPVDKSLHETVTIDLLTGKAAEIKPEETDELPHTD